MSWLWPAKGPITQAYGHNGHPGMDIGAPAGAPIGAAVPGTVVYAQMNNGGYGNLVIVDSGQGQNEYYAHQSRINVHVGEQVNAGDILGFVGSTGYSTGNHLHFEVRDNATGPFTGHTTNPAALLGDPSSGPSSVTTPATSTSSSPTSSSGTPILSGNTLARFGLIVLGGLGLVVGVVVAFKDATQEDQNGGAPAAPRKADAPAGETSS